MSFLNDFEGRISSVFGAAPQGYTEPFSFKKLAKRAAREMENETYEIDGVDTAPALYTVLVSPSDDSLMRPLYEQITEQLRSAIREKLQPTEPLTISAQDVGFELPRSLGEALDQLETCTVLHDLLGSRFVRAYISVKRKEYETFFRVISSWEREFLLLNV